MPDKGFVWTAEEKPRNVVVDAYKPSTWKAEDQQDPLWVPERLVRRIPEDRKAEDVASMDDVKSVEPALVDDIGPAVPPNGDRA
ncbi:hypothetical protein STEG23_036579 [Scotinomys teguina]